MARRGVFVRAEEVAFLEEVRRWRRQGVLVLPRAKPEGPPDNATSKVIGGDRRRRRGRDRRSADLLSARRDDARPGAAARDVAHGGVAGRDADRTTRTRPGPRPCGAGRCRRLSAHRRPKDD
jgi:hypothetical protein